jgi:hypothetical protein
LTAAAVVNVFLGDRGGFVVAAGRGDQRMAAHVAGLRDERLLVRVAVRDQLAARRDDERVAVLADPDLIDHPPHLFEADFTGKPA